VFQVSLDQAQVHPVPGIPAGFKGVIQGRRKNSGIYDVTGKCAIGFIDLDLTFLQAGKISKCIRTSCDDIPYSLRGRLYQEPDSNRTTGFIEPGFRYDEITGLQP
jgi:hypothetical protein